MTNDEQVLKQIIESRANQKLREHINEGKELKAFSIEDKQALERYNQMSETEQKQFAKKGWKNG